MQNTSLKEKMLIDKSKIRQIVHSQHYKSLQEDDEEKLVNTLYEVMVEMVYTQEKTLATKEDIKMLMLMMEKRFEAVDKRFEAVDKRFEDQMAYMNMRFEAVDKRFEAVDKRFEDLIHHLDKRFEQVDKRFAFIFWLIGIGFIVTNSLLVVFKLFA
ncbi:MAG: hypothetical protein HC896_09950 [Bacteroidales bacterium]|nr:hypothetical protein [Bacteroidales bacterium]